MQTLIVTPQPRRDDDFNCPICPDGQATATTHDQAYHDQLRQELAAFKTMLNQCTAGVTAPTSSPSNMSQRHHIISHCVWLSFRFPLSFRDVEEMLAMRGVKLSYETIREWTLKFGQTYTNRLRRKSPRPGRQMAP